MLNDTAQRTLPRAQLERFYYQCLRIRRVEEKLIELYPSDKIKSPVHLSIGQESVSVAVCEALAASDIVFGTYRCHALYLAKGGDLDRMMAELYGKVDGCGRGKAGSMHLVDLSVGVMSASAIVATTLPHAVGYALAQKMKRSNVVVTVFFGEGAMDEGVFHESINFAALKQLPVLFVCENNHYAIYSHIRDRMAGEDPCARARSYQVPATRIDAGDVIRLHERAREDVAAIRQGAGPRFIECETQRWRDHVGPDEDRRIGYRPDSVLDKWIAEDQVGRLGALLPDDRRRAIEAKVDKELAAAVDFAERSPFPADAELYDHVFHG
jgi:TPP-dependent pyruvate/acetoin dehydrogenase alpha subunit